MTEHIFSALIDIVFKLLIYVIEKVARTEYAQDVSHNLLEQFEENRRLRTLWSALRASLNAAQSRLNNPALGLELSTFAADQAPPIFYIAFSSLQLISASQLIALNFLLSGNSRPYVPSIIMALTFLMICSTRTKTRDLYGMPTRLCLFFTLGAVLAAEVSATMILHVQLFSTRFFVLHALAISSTLLIACVHYLFDQWITDRRYRRVIANTPWIRAPR